MKAIIDIDPKSALRRSVTRGVGTLGVVAALVAAALSLACVKPTRPPSDTPTDGGAGVDEVAALESTLVAVEFPLATSLGGDASVSLPNAAGARAVERWSAEKLARQLYRECTLSLTGTDTNGDGTPEVTRSLFGECPPVLYTADSATRPGFQYPAPPSSCRAAMCLTHAAACVSDALLEIARGVDEYVPGKALSDGRTWRVPPQSSEAQVRIAEVAMRWSMLSGTTAAENLRSGHGRYTSWALPDSVTKTIPADRVNTEDSPRYPGMCTATPANADDTNHIAHAQNIIPSSIVGGPSVTFTESLAQMFVHANISVREAAEIAVTEHVALADAQHSNNTSLTEAARRAWIDPTSSRARAAHLLVGGDPKSGLQGMSEGLCPVSAPSDAVRRATDFIRASGLGLATLKGITSDSVLVSTVFSRLNTLGRFTDLPSPTSALILADAGLTPADYLAARDLIVREQEALGAAADHFFTHSSGLALASATTNGSGDLPPSVSWSRALNGHQAQVGNVTTAQANLARFTEDVAPALAGDVATTAPLVAPDVIYARRSLAHYVDYAASVSYDLLSQTSPVAADARRVLERVALTTVGERTGRVVVCFASENASTTSLRVTYVGANDTTTPYLAIPTSNAYTRCALAGHVHGSPCTLNAYYATGSEVGSQTLPERSRVGMPRAWSTLFAIPVGLTEPLYLLRRKASAALTPGNFDAITPLPWFPRVNAEASGLTANRCMMIPVVPDLIRKAAEVVEPSRETCSRGTETCAGVPLDQRIPLEDELTDDGNDIESSWRHYLTVAEAAANEADTLGESVVTDGLEIERRVEEATRGLEATCGGPITVDFFSSFQSTTTGSCTGTGTVTQANGIVVRCINGTYVPDAIETLRYRAARGNGDASKLLSCIADSSVAPYASLGDRPQCIYVHAQTNEVCPRNVAGTPSECPLTLDDDPSTYDRLDPAARQAWVTTRCMGKPGWNTLPSAVRFAAVGTNLGLIKDPAPPPLPTINSTGQPELTPAQKAARFCTTLRQVRTLSPTLGSAATDAMAAVLLRNTWLSAAKIEEIARRVSWEGQPFDHAVLRIDGIEWARTGNPTTNLPPGANLFPCQNDATVGWTVGPGSSPGTCTTQADQEQHPLLACASIPVAVCQGADEPEYIASAPPGSQWVLPPRPIQTRRARAAQRLGRAALTLRLLGGVGLSGISQPAIRTLFPGNRQNDIVSRYDWSSAPSSALLYPFVGSGALAAETSNSIKWTSTQGENSSKEYSGTGYCLSTIAPVPYTTPEHYNDVHRRVWSVLRFDALTGLTGAPSMEYRTSCDETVSMWDRTVWDRNVENIRAPLFFGNEAYTGEDVAAARNRAFQGTGGTAAPTGDWNEKAPLEALLSIAFQNAAANVEDAQLLNPTGGGDHRQDIARLTTYWETDEGAPRQDPKLRDKAMLMGDGVFVRDVMDALELACMADTANAEESCSPQQLQTLAANGIEDVASMESFLRCSAGSVARQAERLIVTNVPNEVVDALKSPRTSQGLSGERGASVERITSGMIRMRDQSMILSSVVRDAANDVRDLRLRLEESNIGRDIARLNRNQTAAQAATSCASAAGGLSFSAAATCAGAAVEIVIAGKRLAAELQRQGVIDQQSLNDFNTRFSGLTLKLGGARTEIEAAVHEIQGGLIEIDQQRATARRSLSEALMFSSEAAGRNLQVNTVLRRRFTTTQARYQRAHRHAVRMAFLAKRALEQRLGFSLSTMTSPLSLVEAPARWEAKVCTTTGVDYARLRDEASVAFNNYSDQFIGDYVDNLERVAESYRLDFPFHEGTDTAVFSLRDDVLQLRASCPDGVPSPNLLRSSSDLTSRVWSPEASCTPIDHDANPATAPVVRNCVTVRPSVQSHTLVDSTAQNARAVLGSRASRELTAATPYVVVFGPPHASNGDPTAPSSAVPSSATTATYLAQRVTVGPGTYFLSWYMNAPNSYDNPANIVRAYANGARIPLTLPSSYGFLTFPSSTASSNGAYWVRVGGMFRVTRTTELLVGVFPRANNDGSITTLTGPQAVEIAGIQLERVANATATLDANAYRPRSFFGTDANALTDLPYCEDTEGVRFRGEGWRYDCMRLCRAGFRRDCSEEEAQTYCYWERTFTIAPSDLETSGRFERAGFAIGNFNYRMEEVGVNFVGTGIRTCSTSTNPSSCNAQANVLYTIEHQGPYPVRNHAGELYFAPIFDGVIEHARGIAAERYLTNPLSSADSSLIGQVMRRELRGRPLTGHYVIRIWDTGDVDFNAIDDLQLLVKYRYWTRFN